MARCELALGAGQVPPVELLDPGEIGAVGLERGGGRPGEADPHLVRRAREVEQLGGELVEQRPDVGAGAVVHPGHVHPVAAGDVVHPRREVERVARLGEVAQHDGPDAGLPGQPPGHVEPDVVARPEPVLGQEIVQPLVVHDREVVPLATG